MSTRIKWLERTALKLPFHLVLVTSPERYARLMRWMKVPVHQWHEFPTKAVPGKVGGRVTMFEKDGDLDVCVVTIIPTIGDPAVNLSKIVHEAVHVYQNIKEAISPNHDMGREPEAYIIQGLYDLLVEEFARQVKRASWVRPSRRTPR